MPDASERLIAAALDLVAGLAPVGTWPNVERPVVTVRIDVDGKRALRVDRKWRKEQVEQLVPFIEARTEA